MSEGMQIARFAAFVGKPLAARCGRRRVTIEAVGRNEDGSAFVMATFADGSVVLGEPGDFTVPVRAKRRAASEPQKASDK